MARGRKPKPPDQPAATRTDENHGPNKINSRFYSTEFKRRLVEMVRAGRTPEDLARDFEPAPHEREERNRLRRENRMLREEKEILKKAAAWFAQESCSTPPKRSGS